MVYSLIKLEQVYFEQSKNNTNPICKRKDYYIEVFQNLKIFGQLQVNLTLRKIYQIFIFLDY